MGTSAFGFTHEAARAAPRGVHVGDAVVGNMGGGIQAGDDTAVTKFRARAAPGERPGGAEARQR